MTMRNSCINAARREKEFHYSQIRGQRSLMTRGGINTILFVGDEEINLYSSMQNLNAFLNKAFYRWCAAKGIDPDSVENNPRMFTWFPDPEKPAKTLTGKARRSAAPPDTFSRTTNSGCIFRARDATITAPCETCIRRGTEAALPPEYSVYRAARDQKFICRISTSVVHRLPKPRRRVRFPYPASI